jgi:hypothetical protein
MMIFDHKLDVKRVGVLWVVACSGSELWRLKLFDFSFDPIKLLEYW